MKNEKGKMKNGRGKAKFTKWKMKNEKRIVVIVVSYENDVRNHGV